MKKYLLLFTALLGLGLNTQAAEVTEITGPVDLTVSVKNSQWDASAILTDGSLPTSGTITVQAAAGTDVTFTDNADSNAKSTTATADGDGVATLDLSTATGLSEAEALYVIGENITSVVYQSIEDAPVAVEAEISEYSFYLDGTEGCWATDGGFPTTLADGASIVVTANCQYGPKLCAIDKNNTWTGTDNNLQPYAGNADQDGSYTFTIDQNVLTALFADAAEAGNDAGDLNSAKSSTEQLVIYLYADDVWSGKNGITSEITNVKYFTSSSDTQGTELTGEVTYRFDFTGALEYPDETITVNYDNSSYTGWPTFTLWGTSNHDAWPMGFTNGVLSATVSTLTDAVKKANSTTIGSDNIDHFYMYIPSVTVEPVPTATYGTNITVDPETAVTPLDGTATFTEEAIAAFNSEGTEEFTDGPDANNIATTGTVETTFTLTLTPLDVEENKVELTANGGSAVDITSNLGTANNDGTYSLTATEIAALLQPAASPVSLVGGDGEDFTLSSLTITGISTCSYTVTTKTTTTAGTYDPDVTYALDMDALYTYMNGTSGRVDQTSKVDYNDNNGAVNDFTWDTDKDSQLVLTEDDLAAVDANWLTIEDGADLRFRVNNSKNLVQLNGAVSFTMTKPGTVTVELASTGGTNYSSFALSTTEDGVTTYIEVSQISGEYEENNETKYSYVGGKEDGETVDGKTLYAGQYATYTSANHTTAVWEVEAGEYTFATALAGTWSRAARIYALEVVEKGAGWEDAEEKEFTFTEDEIAALAKDGTNTTVTADDGDVESLTDEDGNDVYQIYTEYTATLIVSIPADSEGVTFSFGEYTTEAVEGTEIAGADILTAIQAVEGAESVTYETLTSLTLGGAYAYSIVTEEKVTYTYYTTTETVDGFLTVTLAGETVGDADQEAKVTITTNDVTGEVTMAIDEISVTDNISLTNVAVTFTPDADGAFTEGAVSVDGSEISTSATGSYVINDEGDITFSANFTYLFFNIGVSFTTIEPTTEGTEATWTIITNQFDSTPYIADDGNSWLALSKEALTAYTYIALDVTVDLEATYSNFGALLTAGDWSVKYTNSDYDQTDGNFDNLEGTEHVYLVFSVATLNEACSTINDLPFAFWGNVKSVSVYGSADYAGEVGTFYPKAEVSGEETPELSTLYTFTDSVIITIATDPTSDNLPYGAVNQYNATSLLQLANIDGFGWGDFSGLTEDDIVTVTVTIDFTNCTAANYEGLKVALQGFNTSWGGWSSVDAPAAEASAVELTVTATIGELMKVNNITDYTLFGGFALQIWNISADGGLTSDYEGAVVTYTLTIEGVRDGAEEAIANVKSDVEVVEVARYNLMGQKISGAEKGINIIVYSDGSTKKVLVK